MIEKVDNSLTVHDNSWTLRFDNSSEFQGIISDSNLIHPPPLPPASIIMTYCVWESICDLPLKKKYISKFVKNINIYWFILWFKTLPKLGQITKNIIFLIKKCLYRRAQELNWLYIRRSERFLRTFSKRLM